MSAPYKPDGLSEKARAWLYLIRALPILLGSAVRIWFTVKGTLRPIKSTPRIILELRDSATKSPISGMVVACNWETLDRNAWFHGARQRVHNWHGISNLEGLIEIPSFEDSSFDGAFVFVSADGQHPIFAGNVMQLRISPFQRAHQYSIEIDGGGTATRLTEREKDGELYVCRYFESLLGRMSKMRVHVRYAPDLEHCAKRVASGENQWFLPTLKRVADYYNSTEFRDERKAWGPRKEDVLRALQEMALKMYSQSAEVPVFNESIFMDATAVEFKPKGGPA